MAQKICLYLKRLKCTSVHLREAAVRVRAVSEEAGELFARGVFPDVAPLSHGLLDSSESEVQVEQARLWLAHQDFVH